MHAVTHWANAPQNIQGMNSVIFRCARKWKAYATVSSNVAFRCITVPHFLRIENIYRFRDFGWVNGTRCRKVTSRYETIIIILHKSEHISREIRTMAKDENSRREKRKNNIQSSSHMLTLPFPSPRFRPSIGIRGSRFQSRSIGLTYETLLRAFEKVV